MSTGMEHKGKKRRPVGPLRSILTAGALTAGLLGGAVAAAPSAGAWGYAGECKTTVRLSSSGTQYIKTPAVWYKGYKNIRCWMDRGSTGPGVKVLQRALKSCYGRSIEVDGIFGLKTHNALVWAQYQESISPDGVYGEQTFKNLKFPNYWASGNRNGCRRS